jgi:hypothetical protein
MKQWLHCEYLDGTALGMKSRAVAQGAARAFHRDTTSSRGKHA